MDPKFLQKRNPEHNLCILRIWLQIIRSIRSISICFNHKKRLHLRITIFLAIDPSLIQIVIWGQHVPDAIHNNSKIFEIEIFISAQRPMRDPKQLPEFIAHSDHVHPWIQKAYNGTALVQIIDIIILDLLHIDCGPLIKFSIGPQNGPPQCMVDHPRRVNDPFRQMATENNILSAHPRLFPWHIKFEAPLLPTNQPGIIKSVLGGRFPVVHKTLPKIQAKNSVESRIHDALARKIDCFPKSEILGLFPRNGQDILSLAFHRKKNT
jgi:hypothetical protein